MLEAILCSFITALTLLIGGYILLKKFLEQAKYEAFEDIMEWIHSEEGAKFIYSVGALIGNGAKAGIGLQKKGGKFSFQDLIMGIAGGWIQEKFGMQQGGEQAPPQPRDTSTGKFKSKY